MLVLFIIFVATIGIISIGFNHYTNGQARHDNKKTIIGNSLMITPFILFGLYVFASFIFQKISFKPNKNDLVGIYEIEDVSNMEIDKKDFKNHKLELYRNGAFKFINKPEIDISCDEGKYKFLNDENEIGLLIDCGNRVSSAKIISNFNSFEIKFEIGDLDSGESIYYKKN